MDLPEHPDHAEPAATTRRRTRTVAAIVAAILVMVTLHLVRNGLH